MKKEQILLLKNTPARIKYLKILFQKEILNGMIPKCDDCFLQFTMELYDAVKEEIPEEIKEMITGQDLRIATEWAWNKVKKNQEPNSLKKERSDG